MSQRRDAFRDDTPFEIAIDMWCQARNSFGALRRWPGLGHGAEAVEPDELRTAAQAFRDACDQLADMPERTSDGQRTGADLSEKARLAGDLMLDAAALNEPWMAELAKRIVARSVAAHPGEFPRTENGEAK